MQIRARNAIIIGMVCKPHLSRFWHNTAWDCYINGLQVALTIVNQSNIMTTQRIAITVIRTNNRAVIHCRDASLNILTSNRGFIAIQSRVADAHNASFKGRILATQVGQR